MNVPHGIKQAAAMVLLESDRGVLLLRRSKPPHQGTHVPVGGKLEPCEAPVEAARREVEEETGFVVESPTFRGVLVETSGTAFNWTTHIYSAGVDGDVPGGTDEGELEWVARDHLAAVETPAVDRHVFRSVRRQEPFVFDARYEGEGSSRSLVWLVEELSGEVLVDETG